MSSVNKVIIIGNLGRDPEVRTFPSGDKVANVAIATTDRWKDKTSGEMMEATEWHRVSFFGRLAEIAGEYLRKGSQVYVEGSIRTRKYTDKDGVEKFSTEIRADEMKMLGKREDGGGNQAGQDGGYGTPQRQAAPARGQGQQRQAAPARGTTGGQQRPQPSRPASGFDDMDDDIPF